MLPVFLSVRSVMLYCPSVFIMFVQSKLMSAWSLPEYVVLIENIVGLQDFPFIVKVVILR